MHCRAQIMSCLPADSPDGSVALAQLNNLLTTTVCSPAFTALVLNIYRRMTTLNLTRGVLTSAGWVPLTAGEPTYRASTDCHHCNFSPVQHGDAFAGAYVNWPA